MRTIAALLILLFVAGCASSGSKKRKEEAKERRRRSVLLTTTDDERVGAEAARSVQAEIGTLDDKGLNEYVQRIGRKVLRGLPRRDFAYRFSVVDQMEPNAFALPGGHIFISRGLLALVNEESELACVIGHEIVHAARRHSAQQQAVARAQGALMLPRSRAATLAAYGRDMEREADRLGQQLCAAAGYDPMAMASFMRSLDQRERLLIGRARRPTFIDTHPGTRERAAVNSARASELRYTPDPALAGGKDRERHLNEVEHMVLGDRPEAGVFVGELFLHPALDFEIRFPKRWPTQNSARAVGATAPRRDAAIYLAGDLPPGDIVEVADKFAADAKEDFGLDVTEKKRARIAGEEAVRYTFKGGPGGGVTARVTFFPFAGTTWRMVGIAPSVAANRYLPPILISMNSFGKLSDENRRKIFSDRLEIVLARSGEDIIAVGDRSTNLLDPASTALLNGLFGNEVFVGGELIKIVQRSPYASGPAR